MSDRPPTVSVIIVNWNTRELLRACLDSLPWDSERMRIEVIVVDNASEDGSATMVAEQFPQARVLRNRENVGVVRATHQGLRAATGEFLFMLNSDTEVRPGAIERLVEVLAADERIGAVGPRLLNPDGTSQSNAAPPSQCHPPLPCPRASDSLPTRPRAARAGESRPRRAVAWLAARRS